MTTKKPPAKPAPLPVVAFRLEAELMAGVDRHTERLRRQHKGLRVGRSDAIRELIRVGLSVVDKEGK